MMAGNPSWRSMSNMRSSSQEHHNTSTPEFLPTCASFLAQYHEGFDHHRSSSSSSILSLNSSFANDDDLEQLPHSWSQLLVGGLATEEDKYDLNRHFHTKKLENWDQIGDHVKQENSQSGALKYSGSTHGVVDDDHELINHNRNSYRGTTDHWSHQQSTMPVSSPRSSVTSLGSNFFDFSSNKGSNNGRTQIPDHTSECNSRCTGGVSKKAKVHSSSTQPPLKVRKEKLGDRITALHQIVSPFGKTDTASVLLEAIGYIRFLQGQIEALSSPYLSNASTNIWHQQHGNQKGNKKDLKSRGLCLVPVSYTHHFGNDNGADYWAPAPGGGF